MGYCIVYKYSFIPMSEFFVRLPFIHIFATNPYVITLIATFHIGLERFFSFFLGKIFSIMYYFYSTRS